MPHRDNGGDCKKEETGGNNCHIAFAVLFSLFPKRYPHCQLRPKGYIKVLVSKDYYAFFLTLTSQAETLMDIQMPNLHYFQ